MSGLYESLIAVAASTIERETERDPVPAFVHHLCATRAGKPVTTRDAQAIEAAFPGLTCRLVRQYGMTHVEWWVDLRYPESLAADEHDRRQALKARGINAREHGKPESYASILVQHTEKGARWDSAFLESRNAWCYRARDERNEQRAADTKALQSDDTQRVMRAMATCMEQATLMAQEVRGYLPDLPEAVRNHVVAWFDDLHEGIKKAGDS